MDRRDFWLSGYSLLVNAAALPAAQITPSQGAIRREFDKIAPPEGARKMAGAEPHMTLVELETDLLVAGGGLAGVCAAVSAARHGAKVVLVQDRSRLGGNSSSEVKMHVVGANSHKGRGGWREGGLLEEIRLEDAVNNPQRCWELWDLLLYDKVVSEPNITLLLESVVYSAKTKNGRIEEAMVRCDKSEHLYRVKAKLFMDCTGDSRLGLEAGAEMRSGREAKSEFNETLAPEKPDQETLGSSILFTSRLYQKPMPFTAPKWARKVTADTLQFRKITSWEYGYWWVEWGGSIDPIRDNERIRFELLSIVMGVWDYIKNSGNHTSSANWAMDWVGFMPGKRGSRRIVGDHLLSQNDLLKGDFADAVAIGGWPMDDHPPGGFDRADLPPAVQIRTPEVFNIPLRSFYSKNVSNLMMAGRNISATHVAFTSTRVMATCAVGGQAAGTAAAMCLARGITPRQLAQEPKLVSALQQRLLRDDQTIKHVRNTDPADLARTARASASAEIGDAKAMLVLDGVARDIPGQGIHHWEAPLDSWIALAWDKPQRVGELQITFDSGFQRELTLTSSDSINRGIVRAAQPETVRDYEVQVRKAGATDWTTVASVTGNFQRVRRHRFAAVEVEAVRVQAKSTNGSDSVRVFELRCYA
ncbi:MAG: FAD-dependent oxidoreductase [Bryobacterales bacterium]|nr:FAD-dependent oxidoreductase [Bryobacterales bacterium]